MRNRFLVISLAIFALFPACKQQATKKTEKKTVSPIEAKVDEFIKVKLTSDISFLTEQEKQILKHLFDAAKLMDDIYWEQAYGDKDKLFSSLKTNAEKEFARINYGPWERLNGNEPFIDGIDSKPKGAKFYPSDMTKEEFEQLEAKDKTSLYTLIRRDENGKLKTVPYHVAYKEKIEKAVEHMRKAAKLAEDKGLKKYLELRAEALLTDDYLASDMAWMDMKTNNIDFVVGPIENYEDGLFGYKAAHESFILIKDPEWSKKLERFIKLLPALQKSLPVEEKYKQEVPGSDSDLGVYDAVFYAGDCNAGSKTIAINLPNDERVHIEKGSRKLQLKNSMRYKFEKILVPISNLLIDETQRKHIKFQSFFENTMFHEVAHGLGIKNTINGKGTARAALKEQYSSLEEGKADILGLYMISELVKMGELKDVDLMDNYVTFLAGIFRSVRFGAASSHGKANMVRFYHFKEAGAFSYDQEKGTYKVNFEKMTAAINDLGSIILAIQGNGDYEGAKNLINEKGFIKEDLQKDLDRVAKAGIPKDICFEQGPSVLGL